MSKIRSEAQRAATREEIKITARRIMGREGTANISIRGIGREMQITAPALYHYYPSRDALITDLVLDAFTALADALEWARDNSVDQSPGSQLLTVLLAYREWALAHPIDFQLIYGNPIPGYQAPAEMTVPAATRSFIIIAGLIARVIQDIPFSPRPEYSLVPVRLVSNFEDLASQIGGSGDRLPELALYLTTVGWPRIHGIIMLELFHHIQPVAGDMDAFYQIQVEDMLRSMGLQG